jgi:hypothetical protein
MIPFPAATQTIDDVDVDTQIIQFDNLAASGRAYRYRQVMPAQINIRDAVAVAILDVGIYLAAG